MTNPTESTRSDAELRDSRRVDHPALERRVLGRSQKFGIDKIVFGVAAALAIGFVLWGVIATASLADTSATGLDWVVTNAGWLFALVATGFVVFVIWLAASRYGNIPLGRDGEPPEFRTVSWIAMMFSAGMGIGLMFWGAAEPLLHYLTPPPGTGEASAETALATTAFHWTLHPWAIYTVAGLAIAYGVFRKGRGLTISAVFEPIFGRKQAEGPAGKVIDIFAIFATLFGSATSLGLGALQISSGAQILGWVDGMSNTVLIGIITVLTICFIISAVSGIDKGIQYLSNTNMVLAFILALFVFVVGPTVFILNMVPTTLGTYFQHLIESSARTNAVGGQDTQAWLSSWTIFYWAWWISWTPFVGTFIARISRGRTIRQFVAGVLLVPSVVSLIWFAIFGGAAVNASAAGVTLEDPNAGPEATLFALLGTMPWESATSVLVMVLVAIFFVSGADASSIVMGSLSEHGTLEPGKMTVIFWGVATGAAAAVMLSIGGEAALEGLQQVTIVASLPFMIIMVGMAVALVKDLQTDPIVVRQHYASQAIDNAVLTGVTEHGDDFALSIDQAEPGYGIDRDKALSNGSGTSDGSDAGDSDGVDATSDQPEDDFVASAKE